VLVHPRIGALLGLEAMLLKVRVPDDAPAYRVHDEH
jgi:hypothetical protein